MASLVRAVDALPAELYAVASVACGVLAFTTTDRSMSEALSELAAGGNLLAWSVLVLLALTCARVGRELWAGGFRVSAAVFGLDVLWLALIGLTNPYELLHQVAFGLLLGGSAIVAAAFALETVRLVRLWLVALPLLFVPATPLLGLGRFELLAMVMLLAVILPASRELLGRPRPRVLLS